MSHKGIFPKRQNILRHVALKLIAGCLVDLLINEALLLYKKNDLKDCDSCIWIQTMPHELRGLNQINILFYTYLKEIIKAKRLLTI